MGLKYFYGRYPDLIRKYQRSEKDMMADSFPDQFHAVVQMVLSPFLTLPFPSLLVPTPFTKGRADLPPAISKTVAPMNVKFCRVLETPLKVLEMLKLFT